MTDNQLVSTKIQYLAIIITCWIRRLKGVMDLLTIVRTLAQQQKGAKILKILKLTLRALRYRKAGYQSIMMTLELKGIIQRSIVPMIITKANRPSAIL